MNSEFTEKNSYDFDFVYHTLSSLNSTSQIEDEKKVVDIVKRYKEDMMKDYHYFFKCSFYGYTNIIFTRAFSFLYEPQKSELYFYDLGYVSNAKKVIRNYLFYLNNICNDITHDNYIDVLNRVSFLEYYYKCTMDYFDEVRTILYYDFEGFDYYPDHTPVFYQPEKVFEYLEKVKDKKEDSSKVKVKK